MITTKGLLMVVSKRWFEFGGGTKFRYTPFYLNLTPILPHFNLFLPLRSAGSLQPRFRNHGLQTLGTKTPLPRSRECLVLQNPSNSWRKRAGKELIKQVRMISEENTGSGLRVKPTGYKLLKNVSEERNLLR